MQSWPLAQRSLIWKRRTLLVTWDGTPLSSLSRMLSMKLSTAWPACSTAEVKDILISSSIMLSAKCTDSGTLHVRLLEQCACGGDLRTDKKQKAITSYGQVKLPIHCHTVGIGSHVHSVI